MKTALVNCADTGPLESLALMLGHAGYRCVLPGPAVVQHLRGLGCDTVIEVDHLVRNWGYDPPRDPADGDKPFMFMDYAPPKGDWSRAFDGIDLYVDVKAHRNGRKVWAAHPNLKGRTLWYRINGGEPEHVVHPCVTCQEAIAVNHERTPGCGACEDCGDEVNPPCPVLTPNRWYGRVGPTAMMDWAVPPTTYRRFDKAYSCWPPFARFHDFASFPRKVPGQSGGRKGGYDPPICLIHNVNGWGYRDLVGPVRELGVRIHGVGSPDGLINHREVGIRLCNTLAYVHLKSNDAPGYALYEALAAGCPVIIPRRLIWRCRMQELFEPGVTCLTFDRETHDPLTPEEVVSCVGEIRIALSHLADTRINQEIGEAGRRRLLDLMWRPDRDGGGFRDFMRRNFG